jgi:hypothetical protein
MVPGRELRMAGFMVSDSSERVVGRRLALLGSVSSLVACVLMLVTGYLYVQSQTSCQALADSGLAIRCPPAIPDAVVAGAVAVILVVAITAIASLVHLSRR